MTIRQLTYRGLLLILLVLSSALRAQEIDHWETMLGPGRICRYLVPNSPVDPNWINPGFDDSSWTSAEGGVGYGDDDDNTIISQAMAVYCRYEFIITSPELIGALILDMDFDDAFVAYLNGTEVARFNLGDAGSPTAWNQSSDGLHEASVYQGLVPDRFVLDTSLLDQLIAGTNTLALEVHNESITSSDLSSNPYLHAGILFPGNHFSSTPGWFIAPLSFDSTLLPLILIDTEGQQIPNEPRITARMKLMTWFLVRAEKKHPTAR